MTFTGRCSFYFPKQHSCDSCAGLKYNLKSDTNISDQCRVSAVLSLDGLHQIQSHVRASLKSVQMQTEDLDLVHNNL